MIRRSMALLPEAPRSILDPSCGSGIFLLRTAQFLHDHGLSKAEVLVKLHALDRSESAVQICRLLLSLWTLERTQLELVDPALPDLTGQIVCGNTLLDPHSVGTIDVERARRLKAFSFEDQFPWLKSFGGFDLIIGNPPYGLSREDRLSPDENALLKEVYRDSRSGKVNKYMLFMARGFGLLADRGALGFIVPNSWLGIDGASAVRRQLLAAKSVAELDVYRFPVFPQLSVETVAVYLSKAKPRNTIKVRLVDEDTEETFTLPIQQCRDGRISTTWSPPVRKVLARIEEQHARLGGAHTIFRPLIAMQAYAVGKGTPPQTEADVTGHVFHAESKLGEDYYPYLEGQDIRPFRIRWSGQWLRHGPWLADAQELGRFQGPRVLVREILGAAPRSVSAAMVEETYLYNKSVLHILPRTPAAIAELPALCALLNSKLVSFILQQLGRKSQRKLFPKVVLADLLDLPIPSPLPAALKEIAATICASRLTDELQAVLDQAVYKAYRLRPAEIETIEACLAPKPRVSLRVSSAKPESPTAI